MKNSRTMHKPHAFLVTGLAFAALLYLSGCGKDDPPAVNSAPTFGEEAYTFEVAENAANGDEVGMVSATDADEGAMLTYSINGDGADNFAISNTVVASGEAVSVTVAEGAALDFEATTSYTLEVQASDGTDTATADLTVTITNVNDNTPAFANAPYNFSLAVDAADGDEVGKVSATDEDGGTLTYTLSGEGSAHFAITDGTDVASGKEVAVAVAANADLTSLASPVAITVTVDDGSNRVDAEVGVVVVAKANTPPVFANTPYQFSIASDADDGTLVGMVSAMDADAGDLLTYMLSGEGADHFEIDHTAVASGEAVPIMVAINADLPSLASPVAITVTVDDGSNRVDAEVGVVVVATANMPPVFANTPYHFSIAADASDDAVVGTVSATDPDTGDLLTYMIGGAGAGHFAVNNTAVASGEAVPISVAKGADLSSLASPVTITVTVADGGASALTATAEVEITIIAGNVAPVFAGTPYTFDITEDAKSGDGVGLVSATDSNTGDLLTYTLSGDGAGHFELTNGTDRASGEEASVVVSSTAALDHETAPSYMLEVQVSDGTEAVTAKVTVNVGDVNEFMPAFDLAAYSFNVASDAVDGAIVGRVSATDADGDLLAYVLGGDGADHFEIHNTAVASGEAVPILVATGANLPSLTGPVTVTTTVSDGAYTATATVEITIIAGNVAPVFAGTPYTFEITENARSGEEVGRVSATDSNIGDQLTYTLSGAGADHFELTNGTDRASGEEASVVVSSTAALDHETAPSYTLQVEVDDGANTAVAAVAVAIIRNAAPVFVGTPYAFEITENARSGAEVGRVSATDADGGAMLTYTLSGAGADHFELTNGTAVASGEEASVVVSSTAALDHETAPSYTLQVEVDDGTDIAVVEVAVAIIRNAAPVFASTPYTFEIAEDAMIGDGAGTVSATDSNTGDRLTYTLSGDEAVHFELTNGTDRASGEEASVIVSAAAALDHETAPSHTFEVQVSDGANTVAATVTVTVGDVNDNSPVLTDTPYTFEILEDAAGGTEVGRVAAMDPDGEAMLTYRLNGTDAGHFMISGTPVASGEEVPITVATSGANLPSLTSPVMLTVTVSDGSNTNIANVDIALVKDYDSDNDGLIDIATLEQLNAIRWDLDGNGEADEATDADAYATAFPGATTFDPAPTGYELMRSLDFDATDSYGSGTLNTAWTTGTGWEPMGHLLDMEDMPYTAAFAGNGHTISHLYISRLDDLGLFALLDAASTVSDLGFVDVNITGTRATGAARVGSLAGRSGGTIDACYSTGKVIGSFITGGLIGQQLITGSITGCYSSAATVESGRVTKNLGGLVGENHGTITDCYATGTVEGLTTISGGLVGENLGTITASHATGVVTSEAVVGGLVGRNDGGTIAACYATGTVTPASDFSGSLGGLVGENGGTITACYATGTVGGLFEVGGLVGRNASTITACYATGAVSAGGQVGGLVGINIGTATACYATGAVTLSSGSSTNIGGLVGDLDEDEDVGTVTASYFNTDNTGQTDAVQGQTTTMLQEPIVYDDDDDAANGSSLYETWNADVDSGLSRGLDNGQAAGDDAADDPWDFGTAMQYPVLKVDFNGDGTATAAEFGTQR